MSDKVTGVPGAATWLYIGVYAVHAPSPTEPMIL